MTPIIYVEDVQMGSCLLKIDVFTTIHFVYNMG
jgi:hypothetical protein